MILEHRRGCHCTCTSFPAEMCTPCLETACFNMTTSCEKLCGWLVSMMLQLRKSPRHSAWLPHSSTLLVSQFWSRMRKIEKTISSVQTALYGVDKQQIGRYKYTLRAPSFCCPAAPSRADARCRAIALAARTMTSAVQYHIVEIKNS
eukprot:5511772-Pleurochrysis_carterae.AAC.2